MIHHCHLNQDRKIFRFKLSDDINTLLIDFCKTNIDKSKNDYKIEWETWYDKNNSILEKEERRLFDIGYNGNVKEKMYKAARYYFSKKVEKELLNYTLEQYNIQIKRQKERRYIPVSNELLTSMDIHIKANSYNNDYTPFNGFIHYLKECKRVIDNEIISLNCKGIIDKDFIHLKIKKTYKNRYYILSRKVKEA